MDKSDQYQTITVHNAPMHIYVLNPPKLLSFNKCTSAHDPSLRACRSWSRAGFGGLRWPGRDRTRNRRSLIYLGWMSGISGASSCWCWYLRKRQISPSKYLHTKYIVTGMHSMFNRQIHIYSLQVIYNAVDSHYIAVWYNEVLYIIDQPSNLWSGCKLWKALCILHSWANELWTKLVIDKGK